MPPTYLPEATANIIPYWNRSLTIDEDEKEALLQRVVNRYDNGVRQTDRVIAEVAAAFRSRSARPTLFVLVGDHGDELGEKGSLGHSRKLNVQHVRIPIVFFGDIKLAFRNQSFGSLLDIAPTIFDLLQVAAPAVWKGVSLLVPASNDRFLFHHNMRATHHCRGVTYYQSKSQSIFRLLSCLNGGAMEVELFEPTADVAEAHPLPPDEPLGSFLYAQMEKNIPDTDFPRP